MDCHYFSKDWAEWHVCFLIGLIVMIVIVEKRAGGYMFENRYSG